MPVTHDTIYQAAAKGDVGRVEALLATVDLTKRDASKRSALDYALRLPVISEDLLRTNKINIARLLIEKDPRLLTTKDEAGNTPVHVMAENGFHELLRNMVQLNPSVVFVPNNAGELPIHRAIAHQQRETSDLLLAIPDMYSYVDDHEKNLFHYAAAFNNSYVLNKLFAPLPKSSMNAKDGDGSTPLDIASQYGHPEIIEILEKHHAQHGNSCVPR